MPPSAPDPGAPRAAPATTTAAPAPASPDPPARGAGSPSLRRAEAEDLLFTEAALLDEWRLEEWLALLTPDVRYEVPTTDQAEGDAAACLYFIADDAARLSSRVRQLLGRHVWAESPRSRTRRLVTNVRVSAPPGDEGETEVTANFAVYRFHQGVSDVFVGRYQHRVVLVDGRPLIRVRRAILDQESLAPQGKISIIL